VLASYDERGPAGLSREPRPVIYLKDMHHNVDKGGYQACNPPVTYLNRGLMT